MSKWLTWGGDAFTPSSHVCWGQTARGGCNRARKVGAPGEQAYSIRLRCVVSILGKNDSPHSVLRSEDGSETLFARGAPTAGGVA